MNMKLNRRERRKKKSTKSTGKEYRELIGKIETLRKDCTRFLDVFDDLFVGFTEETRAKNPQMFVDWYRDYKKAIDTAEEFGLELGEYPHVDKFVRIMEEAGAA